MRSRLGYLKDLGVDAIWFNPWYPSPLADGGYDVSDYRDIHPTFGTLEEAELLISEALALGIRTIIDVVPNHISSSTRGSRRRSPPARARPSASASGSTPARARTATRCPRTGSRASRATRGPAPTNPDGTPGEWYLHLFTPEQPDLNWNHPDVRAEHEDILRFWFDRGVAGVRIDSAALLIKDPDLPEVPEAVRPGSTPPRTATSCTTSTGRGARIADSYEGTRVLVGEVWVPDADRFAAYLRPDEMHTAFNFDFMARPWDAAELRDSIDLTLAAHAPVGAPSTWVLSNHDVTRPVTRYGREDSRFAFPRKRFGTPTDLDLGRRRARAAALLTAALPGSLYIYQGDELGLPEVELPLELIEDPMHFRSGGVDPGRDGCRVPLPWRGAAAPFGFSPAAPGPDGTVVAPGCRSPRSGRALTVQAQEADPASMLRLYRQALRIRKRERLARRRPAHLACRAHPTALVVPARRRPRHRHQPRHRAHGAARPRPHPPLQRPARRRDAASRLHGLAPPIRLTVEAAARTTPRQSPSPHPHHTAPKGLDNEVTEQESRSPASPHSRWSARSPPAARAAAATAARPSCASRRSRPAPTPPPTRRSPRRRSSSRRRTPTSTSSASSTSGRGPTFAVQLAGGSLPDVFTVPFTDSKTLLENGQLMDVTDEIEELGYADNFNPIILDARDGRRRHLRLPAPGLRDGPALQPRAVRGRPASTPTTRPPRGTRSARPPRPSHEKTGKAGYMQMTQNNTGGWQLVAASAARGGSTQNDNGDGTSTSTIDNDATKAALEFLHDLRWEDNSFGSKFQLDWGTINQEFAAGNIGMYTSGSDIYTALVRDFSLNPDVYGLTVMPVEDGGGTLGGGDIAVVSPTVDDTTKAAAVKWIDWYYMQKLLDEDAAVMDAKTLAASDQAVGTPLLPVLDRETYEESLDLDRAVHQRAARPDDAVHRRHLGADARG